MSCIDMAIWVSKDASGLQECRPMALNNFLKSLKNTQYQLHYSFNFIFKSCLMALVCIPVVLTHLLTPILPNTNLIRVRWHMRQIWHFWHLWHKWRIWRATFVMVIYGNMGVKRFVRTSGMQTNTIKQLLNRFNGLSLKKLHSNFSFVILRISFV